MYERSRHVAVSPGLSQEVSSPPAVRPTNALADLAIMLTQQSAVRGEADSIMRLLAEGEGRPDEEA